LSNLRPWFCQAATNSQVKKKKKKNIWVFLQGSVVAGAFQINFYAEIHANDIFLFFKNYFWHQHIKTIQKIQTVLNFSKKKNQICTKYRYKHITKRSYTSINLRLFLLLSQLQCQVPVLLDLKGSMNGKVPTTMNKNTTIHHIKIPK